MKPVFINSIVNLLSQQNDTVSAPMSPMLFAKEVAAQMEFKFNRLARLHFTDTRMNQKNEKGEGWTGHDNLIIATHYKNDFWVSLWVDTGIGGCPVAMGYKSDREIIIAPIYRKADLDRKLTDGEIKELVNYVFDNPQEIAIDKPEQ
jgi:hypothetical protein